MTRSGRRRVSVVMAVVVSSLVVRSALADARRVAAVDPDEQLTRALRLALSPWGATVTELPLPRVTTADPLSVEDARAIARQTRADVVVWVSNREGHHTVWIYDVASDRTRRRNLPVAPPFDATTAAAVALSVKALLRFTVVAPPRERLEPVVEEEPSWFFGLGASLAYHNGSPTLIEPRATLSGSFWPAALDHRVGASLGISGGLGGHYDSTPVDDLVFSGTLQDFAVRAAVAGRATIEPWVALELSVGAAIHFVDLDARLASATPSGTRDQTPNRFRIDAGVEPQLAASFALLGGVVRVAPWMGVTVLTQWQQYRVHKVMVAETAPITWEAGLRLELGVR